MQASTLARDADALQHAWLLPFQLVDLAPESAEMAAAVVAEDGTLFRSDARHAFAVAARSDGGTTLLNVADWAEDAMRRAADKVPVDACALLRCARGDAAAELWIGPRPLRPRRVAEGPVSVLCDYGQVLAGFDRGLFAKHFRYAFGAPPPEEARLLLRSLRPRYEAGDLTPDEFWERVRAPLGLTRGDRARFEMLWQSILWLHPDVAAWMRRAAARDGVAVTVVTNVDPVRLAHARTNLGMADLFEHVVASCDEGVRPKGEDASMWERAQALAAARLPGPAERVIAIDDVQEYLDQALFAGVATHGIPFRHAAQLHWALGAAGLYLPLAEGA